MRYGSWDMKLNRHNFFVILGNFLLFYPPKISKMKKSSGDIIILHECTKSHDHMLYWSWDMACDRCHCYFSFQAIFWPFIPLTAEKIKISKKWENCLEISSFYTWVPKIIIRGYVWLLRYGAQQMDRQMNRWADG